MRNPWFVTWKNETGPASWSRKTPTQCGGTGRAKINMKGSEKDDSLKTLYST